MKKYLLDTNICIAILRKNSEIADILAKIAISQCYISEITLIELKVGEILGKAKAPQGKFINQHIDEFVSRLTILPISGSPDKSVGLGIKFSESEKKEPNIRHSS